tara:strand:- start:3874 stop:5820 length:1947 start_codon:yes stop_codon:yes gene_type:complete
MEYDNNYEGDTSLEGWVNDKCEQWRDHFESNYEERFDEYYRLWRGIWAEEDSMRGSERSRIISPALQQAVESSVAEVEEATFGRGTFFDIKDDKRDPNQGDIQQVREQLTEDFKFVGVRKEIAEVLINSAVFGTGIAEIVADEVKHLTPATQPIMGGDMDAIGVMENMRTVFKVKPVMPNNFLIDPVATSIKDAMGVAIDQFVPYHQIKLAQEAGIYDDIEVGEAPTDTSLEPDKDLTVYNEDKVRLIKYYGLVPRTLFEKAAYEMEDEDLEEEGSEYIEAIVVIANGQLIKVEANPFMMEDRPVVAFPWDVVPGRFWGRGVCEKGYNAQKALDTELRARIDALALTVHPMMAVDASRLPRGSKLEIRPGKTILTNGNPSEILQPFKFGQLDPNTFTQSASLQQMVQMATGAIDAAGIPGSINGDATAAGISMSLGAIIKRHKRTLINFQESFLIPMVEKVAYRYMQFDPERYPVRDFKFVTTSSLGIIAREYEVTQLVQLLQTMSPESPMYPLLIQSIVENMNLSNREEIIEGLNKAGEPKPEEQQMQQQAMEMEMAQKQESIKNIQAQTEEIMSRVRQNEVETQLLPEDSQTKRIMAMAKGGDTKDETDKEFERRAKLAELVLKEREIASKEEIVEKQMRQSNGSN